MQTLGKPVTVHKLRELLLEILYPLLTLLIQMTITVATMKVPWNKKREREKESEREREREREKQENGCKFSDFKEYSDLVRRQAHIS